MSNAAALKTRIIDKLNSVQGTPPDAIGIDKQDKFAQAIAEAVYEHLSTDIKVAIGIPVSTTGTAAAQTGATTALGTIS